MIVTAFRPSAIRLQVFGRGRVSSAVSRARANFSFMYNTHTDYPNRRARDENNIFSVVPFDRVVLAEFGAAAVCEFPLKSHHPWASPPERMTVWNPPPPPRPAPSPRRFIFRVIGSHTPRVRRGGCGVILFTSCQHTLVYVSSFGKSSIFRTVFFSRTFECTIQRASLNFSRYTCTRCLIAE